MMTGMGLIEEVWEKRKGKLAELQDALRPDIRS
jgi:hypothetical protein